METINSRVEDELSLIRHIRDSSFYVLFFVDLTGNILTWNEGAEKVTGYSERDVVGRHYSILYPEDEEKNATVAVKTALEKGYFASTGWRIKKNGQRFWASEIITHLTGTNSLKGFLVIIRKITKDKEADDAAQQWQYMFDHSDWAFAVSFPDKNVFEMVNPAFAKMYGYSVSELIGKPITMVLDPESRKKLPGHIDTVHSKGHHVYESKHIRKDGTSFPVVVDATAVKDNSGKILHRLVSVRDVSELKEIQEFSMVNEEKFQQLFDQASDGIFISDLNGRYTNVNAAACQMLGFTKEELLGKTIMDLLQAEDIPRLQKQKEVLMKPGEILVNEWMLRKKDGSFIPTEISAKILPNGQWQAFVRDISERKKTQEILVRSEQKFRGLLEEYQDAILIVDRHGTIEFVNKQFKNKFGYTPEEIIGKPLEQLIPERFRMNHVGNRMKYMAHPVARPMGLGLDLYALHKDGSEFPVDISLVPFETDKGMVFTAFVRDLSDRKRFEAQQKFLAEISILLSENIDFGQQLKNITTLCIPFLADFCMLFINDKNKLTPKVSLHRDESLKKILEEVSADLFSKPEISPYKAGSKTEAIKPLIIENVSDSFLHAITTSELQFRNFKQLHPQSMLFVPLVARERIVGVLILVMSSSERKFTEEDISFISIVGYRIGLSLDNINLYNEAQQAIKEREDILSIVSHDLRNPLAAIKGGFQIILKLARNKDEEKLTKVVAALTESCDFMERLINDLLDFSKIRQGALPLKLRKVSIPQLCENVIQSVHLKAKEKSINLLTEIPDSDLELVCDGDRIKQVLNNLIGNAIKFTPEKGIVTLKVKDRSENVYFSITDTGPGISKENLPHIFDRYWQEKTTAHLGTGLGLSIAKGILDAHQGKMWIESDLGKGSDFQFEIPKTLKAE